MNPIDNKLIPLAMVLVAMGTACVADGVDEEATDQDQADLAGAEAIDAAPAALNEVHGEARGGFLGSSKGGFSSKGGYSKGGYSKGGYSPYKGGFSPYQGGFSPYQGGFSPYQGGFSPYMGGFSPYQGGFSPYMGGAAQYYGIPGRP